MERSAVVPPAARRRAKALDQFNSAQSASGSQQTFLEWAAVKPFVAFRFRTAVQGWLQFATDTNAKLGADAEVDEAQALHINHCFRRGEPANEENVAAGQQHVVSEFSKHETNCFSSALRSSGR